MTKVVKLLIAVCAAIATLTIAPSPASAHETCEPSPNTSPSGQSDTGCVLDNHYTVWAGDNNCDGRGVYVRFYVRDAASSFRLDDANGCDPGIGIRNTISPVTRFTVCTIGVGCSGYVPA